jgi:hypothetical protein
VIFVVKFAKVVTLVRIPPFTSLPAAPSIIDTTYPYPSE